MATDHDFLTFTTTQHSTVISWPSRLHTQQDFMEVFPDPQSDLGVAAEGLGGVRASLPAARRELSHPTTIAPRRQHLPEEQEIRKTANANFAAAPIFPRRWGEP